MAKRMDPYQDEKGASPRQLVLLFLAAVAVCAVFFSLGFVVGYNHSRSKSGLATENVMASGNIPPTVNPPQGGAEQPSSQGIQTETLNPNSNPIPQPVRPKFSTTEPPATAQTQTQEPEHKAKHKTAPRKREVVRRRSAVAPVRRAAVHEPARSPSNFAVQVMASRTRVDAENLVKLLKSHGFRVYILTPQQAHAKDHLFRVQVGPYPSRVSADSARDKLEGEGFRPFVVHH